MRRHFMPLYIADFIADTVHLSAAETGAYLCLIMDYWLHDGLPDDNRKLAQIARLPMRSWCQMRPTMQAFFHDGWRHKRIDAELDKMVGLAKQRQAAASKGGTQASINRQSSAGTHPNTEFQKNFQSTSKRGSKRGSKTVPNEHYTTQEDLTSTCSGTARARAGPAPKNPANSNNEENQRPNSAQKNPVQSSAELSEILLAKGWRQ